MNNESRKDFVNEIDSIPGTIKEANLTYNESSSKSVTVTGEKVNDIDLRNIGFKLNNPNNYIEVLSNPTISLDSLSDTLNQLIIILKNSETSWIEDFQRNGLQGLLYILNKCYHKTDTNKLRGEKIHLDCLKCVTNMIMKINCTYTRGVISGDPKIIAILCESLDSNFPCILTEGLNILCVIAIIPKGHKLILQAFKKLHVDDHGLQRFQFITNLLRSTNNDDVATSCLTFINTVINSPQDLNLRLSLRNEFLRAGLRDILEYVDKGILKYSSKEIHYQFKLFHQHREKDGDQNFQKFDCLRFQFDDLDECYELVKNSVSGTYCEPLLKSILQHLLFIRDDPIVRISYYRLIEECVSQIVIHHSGCDPDFRPSRKVIIYVRPEIGNVPDNKEDTDNERLKDILLSKHLYEKRIASLESELDKYKTKEQNSLNVTLPVDKEIHKSDTTKTTSGSGRLLSSLRTPKFHREIASPTSKEVQINTNGNYSRIPTYKRELSTSVGVVAKSKLSDERKNNAKSTSKKIENEKTTEEKRSRLNFLKFDRDANQMRHTMLGLSRKRTNISRPGAEQGASRDRKTS